MEIEKRLKEINIALPAPPKKVGVYMPVKAFSGDLTPCPVQVSGCLPMVDGVVITGKLGDDCSMEDGCKAAELCTLNILANLKAHLGDLDRVRNCVKMTVFVASTPDFYQHPQVANAATELLVKIFGEKIGCPTRAAFGVASLPANAAVEIELLVEVD